MFALLPKVRRQATCARLTVAEIAVVAVDAQLKALTGNWQLAA